MLDPANKSHHPWEWKPQFLAPPGSACTSCVESVKLTEHDALHLAPMSKPKTQTQCDRFATRNKGRLYAIRTDTFVPGGSTKLFYRFLQATAHLRAQTATCPLHLRNAAHIRGRSTAKANWTLLIMPARQQTETAHEVCSTSSFECMPGVPAIPMISLPEACCQALSNRRARANMDCSTSS